MAAPPADDGPDHGLPWRRTPPNHPDVSAPARAPAPAPRTSSPTPPARRPHLGARAGNSARGIPKIIAIRSMTNVESGRACRAGKANPSLTACHPVGRALASFRSGGERRSAMVVHDRGQERHDVQAVRHRQTLRGARGGPDDDAGEHGPTTSVVLNMTWFRASAAGSRSRPTTVGTTADAGGEVHGEERSLHGDDGVQVPDRRMARRRRRETARW